MANLPIPDETTWVQYDAQSGTGPFSFTFSVFAKADLRVKVGGTEIAQSGFTFTGTLIDTGYDGGSITLSVAAVAQDVLIWREVTAARTSDFSPASSIAVTAIDAALDRLTAHSQDLRRDVDRSIKVTMDEAGPERTYDQFIEDAAAAQTVEQLADIEEARLAAVASVTTEGNTQDARVTTEGDTQDARVTAEGDTQVARVTAEGDAQIVLVDAAGDDALDAVAAAEAGVVVRYETWAELAAMSTGGLIDGQGAKVYGVDAGTHTDPITSATVDNVGVYRYKTGSPSGWKRIAALEADDASAAAAAAAADAAVASAAAAVASDTVDYIGNPAPAASGSATGNTTYVFDWVAPEDLIITALHTGGLGSGNITLKSFDVVSSAWSGANLGTVAITAGVASASVSYLLPRGQRLGFHGTGLVGTVGNGAPITPYYTITGNVTSGAIGSRTTNTMIQLGVTVQSAKDYEDARVGAADYVSTDTRTFYKGLADADLGSNLSSTTAWFDPRPLAIGVPSALYIYGRVAGWATVLLACRSGETQFDVYRYFPVLLAVGKNTITPGSTVLGKGIPRDVIIRPGTIVGMVCPSGGGQVAYTITDGPGTSGENLIGYQLPQGNFTATGAAAGIQTFTWSSTSNRQLAMEWVIIQENSPRKLRPQPAVMLDEKFTGSTLPTRLMHVGTSPTYATGTATSAATGFGNNLRARFGHALHKHVRIVKNYFGSGASVVASGTRPIAGSYGSAASADCAANNWTIYVGHGASSSTPTVRTTRAWPGTFNAATSRLLWRWERNGRVFRVTLTDYGVQPIVSDYYEVDVSAADIPPAVTTPSESLLYMGMLNGALQSFALSGSVVTIGMWEACTQRRVTGLIVGDSITNASRVAYADGWAQQIEALRTANGQETAIMAVDGWDMSNMRNTLAQTLHLFPDLEWVVVAAGTNRGATSASDPRDQNMFEKSAEATLLDLRGRDITPYFVVPAPHTFSPGAAAQAARLSYLQGTAWRLIRSDLALTIADGVTIDTAKFYNAGASDVHPNETGHDAIVARIMVDAPELLL